MKGRYLLVLAVIVAAVVLALPGAATAATTWSENFDSYAAGSVLVGQGGWVLGHYDISTFVTGDAFHSAPNSLLQPAAPGEYDPAPGAVHSIPANGKIEIKEWIMFPDAGPGSLGLFGLHLADEGGAVAGVAGYIETGRWVQVRWVVDFGARTTELYVDDALVEQGVPPWSTPSGDAVDIDFAEDPSGQFCYIDDLMVVTTGQESPSELLSDLGDFISTPTAGTISRAAANVLGAEVNLAAKLLAQGHPKLAVAMLKVVIAEVKVLPTRVVSADARAEIIAQANAIIAAINQ
jgi:hypothetical protein